MCASAPKPSDLPRYNELMWPMLVALHELGGTATNRETDAQVVSTLALTEAEQSLLIPSGKQSVIVNRLHWARSYLRMSGAIENVARAVVTVTPYGRTLTHADMATLDAQVRARHSKRVRPRPNPVAANDPAPAALSQQHDGDDDENEDDSASFAFIEDEALTPLIAEEVLVPDALTVGVIASTDPDVWRGHLLHVLNTMSADAFAHLCQLLLQASGFESVEVTRRFENGDIDGIGTLQNRLLSMRVFVQCRRNQRWFGPSDIHDVRAAMSGRADKGLFITTGTFTSSAQQEATRDGAPVLDLIDGEALCDLLKDCRLGVSTRQVEEVTIDPEWFAQL